MQSNKIFKYSTAILGVLAGVAISASTVKADTTQATTNNTVAVAQNNADAQNSTANANVQNNSLNNIAATNDEKQLVDVQLTSVQSANNGKQTASVQSTNNDGKQAANVQQDNNQVEQAVEPAAAN